MTINNLFSAVAKTLCLVTLTFFSTNAFGQIKIDAYGRVLVGPSVASNFDPDTVLSMSIQGKKTSLNNAGSKLGFGDFGIYAPYGGGWNAFIGEYGNTDSDILWLHGKNGIRFTNLNGSNVVLEVGCGSSLSGVFMQDIMTGRVVVSSDDASRSTVSQVSGALQSLLQLNAVSYHNVVPEDYYRLSNTELDNTENDGETRNSAGSTALYGKALADSVRFAVSDSIRAAGTDRYGFVTSELQQVFPNLVTTDDRGNKYIDYIGIIPLIVAALEEQQQTIELLTAQLNVCCSQNDNSGQSSGNGGYNTKSQKADVYGEKAELFQNNPNPFSQETEIGYYLPRETRSAEIFIFSLNGTLVKTLSVKTMGKGSVTVDASTLAAGMYVYTLVADGTIVDSKRMILTE